MKVGWIVIQIWFLQMCLSLESQKSQKYSSYYIQKEFAFPYINFFLCYREARHKALIWK